MIQNPILPGFHADPCICRRGGDFYLAVSSFEWMPGIPVYHSRDLAHWELLTHILTEYRQADLKNLPSAKGIWAPCLSWCEADGLFYAVYGVMHSTNARYFDVDNFLITSPDITGPWSEPVYLHSAGFDASLFHDDDGRKWLVSLQWETRDGYEKPGYICLAEYDPAAKAVKGYPKFLFSGGTKRGCIEGPHLYKRNGWYYLMCAEGGTGYYHCVTMARAKHIEGPYEPDPENPILTSAPGETDERENTDHLKPQYYNPAVPFQKAGHGSLIDTPAGEYFLVHHMARPFVPELCCTLGRETAIQKAAWTEDGWLRLAGGGVLPQTEVPDCGLPESSVSAVPERDDFDSRALGNFYYAPRIMPGEFADVCARPGWVRIRGQEAQTSQNKVSLLARKLTSLHVQVTTKMEFTPEVPQHSAGLILYYDNMNFILLRKYRSETLGAGALSVLYVENGKRREYQNTRTAVKECPVYLRLSVDGRRTWFSWGYDGVSFTGIGPDFATAKFSDEYSEYGEFTGTFVGVTCADRLFHRHCADFDFLEYTVTQQQENAASAAER